jgi:hypothetical protein
MNFKLDFPEKLSRLEPLNQSSHPVFQCIGGLCSFSHEPRIIIRRFKPSDDDSPSPGGRASSERGERHYACCSFVGEGELSPAETRGSDQTVHGKGELTSNMQITNNHSLLARAFILCVLCLAVFQFSENTADPDIWSHIYFGAQFVQTGKPTTIDYFSWTAYHQPSFDHEYLGEAVFGLAYLGLGGPGVLLLKILVGLATFGLALSIASKNLDANAKLLAWVFGALAVVEISFGFAARPQIFTALSLAVELWLLGRIHSGKWLWAFAFPPLFALWFNLHGGALVGLVLLFAAAAASSVQLLLTPALQAICGQFSLSQRERAGVRENRSNGNPVPVYNEGRLCSKTFGTLSLVSLWLSALVSAATVVLNPHRFELARWLVGSVLWLRPQIQEWNPATFDWEHAAFFFCAALAALAFLASRRPRQLWEIAVLLFLFLVAFRAIRNTPLFCVAALALVPPHLADVLQRFRHHFQRFETLLQSPARQKTFTAILVLISAGIITATFTLHKKHFWTMEIPRAQYPVAAINFIQQHDLRGNLLVFFDWGEMCFWNLPDSHVSLDGRLDSVYSSAVIAAHWHLYNGEPFDANALNLARADFALLPSNLAGSVVLAKNDGWQAVYYDNLAVVLVKEPGQFLRLAGLTLPVQGPASATEGRDAFPNHLPRGN